MIIQYHQGKYLYEKYFYYMRSLYTDDIKGSS